jgi:hypothetical protein
VIFIKRLSTFFKRKTKDGTGDFIFPMYMILFCIMLFSYCYYDQILYYTKTNVEDSVAAATLASACVNLYDYGDFDSMSYEIINSCYDLFEKSLSENMSLDGNLKPTHDSFGAILITEPVEILEYSYYCIRDGIVYKTTKNGSVNVNKGFAGQVTTPNGNVISQTTIYAKIRVSVKNPYTKEIVTAIKDFSVDIVEN